MNEECCEITPENAADVMRRMSRERGWVMQYGANPTTIGNNYLRNAWIDVFFNPMITRDSKGYALIIDEEMLERCGDFRISKITTGNRISLPGRNSYRFVSCEQGTTETPLFNDELGLRALVAYSEDMPERALRDAFLDVLGKINVAEIEDARRDCSLVGLEQIDVVKAVPKMLRFARKRLE